MGARKVWMWGKRRGRNSESRSGWASVYWKVGTRGRNSENLWERASVYWKVGKRGRN